MKRAKRKTEVQPPEAQRPVFLHHGRPTTRREFLASGLAGASGYIMLPSALSVLLKGVAAEAQSSGACFTESVYLPPFISINLNGGASFAANCIPLDKGGQQLSNYDILSLGNGNVPVETEFQGVHWAGKPTGSSRLTAQMLEGIRQGIATDATQRASIIAKTAFLSVCVYSQDDTINNNVDVSGLVTAAGLAGELLPNIGTIETGVGVNNLAALKKPPSPLIVRNLNDITSALAPARAIENKLSSAQKGSLFSLIRKLGVEQSKAIRSPGSSTGETLSKLLHCATDRNVTNATSLPSGINPMVDPLGSGVSALWSMDSTSAVNGYSQKERQVMGSIVYSALGGRAGAVGLDLPSYDYHQGNRLVIDGRDFEAGWLIGRVIASAANMNRRVFIHITTDGGTACSAGASINDGPTGDRGLGGMMFMMMYDPQGRPQMKDPTKPGSWQIGHFTKDQAADDKTPVGNIERAAAAVFANYLQFSSQLPLMEKLLGRYFSTEELDYVLRIA